MSATHKTIVNGSQLYLFEFDKEVLDFAKTGLYNNEVAEEDIGDMLAQDLGQANFDGFNLMGEEDENNIVTITKADLEMMIASGLKEIL